MKSWQILAVGCVGLAVVFLLTSLNAYAFVAAVVVFLSVVAGFAARPARDTYFIPTKHIEHIPLSARPLQVVHDCIAVRVHIARLWLLFIPTFGAVAVLMTTAAYGTSWVPGFRDLPYPNEGYSIGVLILQPILTVVIGIISCWLGERWVLRNAEACSVSSLYQQGKGLAYSFTDKLGEFYGGVNVPFSRMAPELHYLVFYSLRNPQLSRLAIGMLFHRFEVIGRGVPDFDEATVTAELKGPVSSSI